MRVRYILSFMQSYASGPALPLLEKTIGQALSDSAARRPSGMALIVRHQNVRHTYAGLLAEAERKGLLQSGFDLSVVRMLAMGALTWAAEWYDPEGDMTLDDIADELMRVLTRGIVKS